jgi:hypothetical protein
MAFTPLPDRGDFASSAEPPIACEAARPIELWRVVPVEVRALWQDPEDGVDVPQFVRDGVVAEKNSREWYETVVQCRKEQLEALRPLQSLSPPQGAAPSFAARLKQPPLEPDLEVLKRARKLRCVLEHLELCGYKEIDDILAVCQRIRGLVPALSRIENLTERVTRAFEVLTSEREATK